MKLTGEVRSVNKERRLFRRREHLYVRIKGDKINMEIETHLSAVNTYPIGRKVAVEITPK